MMTDPPNVILVRHYLAALGRGEPGDAMKRFYDPDFVQTEFPNALNPKGQRSNLADSLARAERGKKLLGTQTFDVRTAVSTGDTVAVEGDWSGTLAIPALGLPAEGQMKAHFAMFIEVRKGKIFRQRNYDCFEPWEGR